MNLEVLASNTSRRRAQRLWRHDLGVRDGFPVHAIVAERWVGHRHLDRLPSRVQHARLEDADRPRLHVAARSAAALVPQRERTGRWRAVAAVTPAHDRMVQGVDEHYE